MEAKEKQLRGKGESSIFRSVEIKAQLTVADRQEERNREGG